MNSMPLPDLSTNALSIPSQDGPDLLVAALAYATLGWRVFPLAPRSKRPIRRPGHRAATSDPQIIRAWWAANPTCNIGLATGAGLIVLDIDALTGGLAWWIRRRALLPPTVTARTGSGGLHLLYQVPADQIIRNSVGRIARGVDVRGDGGYVVVPPSIHPSGRPYCWLPGRSPWEYLCAPLPATLLTRLTRPLSSETPSITAAQIPMGTRNSTLTSLAGTMRRRNMSPAAITAALLVENATRCVPPLPIAEVQRIVISVSRYLPARTRR
jgi:putative DNA primase/helicase